MSFLLTDQASLLTPEHFHYLWYIVDDSRFTKAVGTKLEVFARQVVHSDYSDTK